MKLSKQKFTNYIAAIFTLFFVWGCGDDGPSQSQTETATFSGTTQGTTDTGCSGDSHVFQAADGNVSVTLVQSTGNSGLAVQVCAGGIDNNNCTINQTPIAWDKPSPELKKAENRKLWSFNRVALVDHLCKVRSTIRRP